MVAATKKWECGFSGTLYICLSRDAIYIEPIRILMYVMPFCRLYGGPGGKGGKVCVRYAGGLGTDKED